MFSIFNQIIGHEKNLKPIYKFENYLLINNTLF